MSFFHLRSLPGSQWPPLPDSVFAQVWNAYVELDRTQWLSPAELLENQLRQVRTLLAHCLDHVPYYRRVLGEAGITPAAIRSMEDFRRLPLLPRRTYQEQNASFVATHLPPGTKATVVSQTSGSSGTPTDAHLTNMTQLWWHAFYLRDLEWCGLDPTGAIAVIRYTEKIGPELEPLLHGVSASCWSGPLDPLIQTGAVHLMDIHQDPRKQYQWLRHIAPDYLLSYPPNLESLALLARQEGPIPSLRAIQAISSTLSPETQAEIESAFGVPVKNTYSCNEVGYLASPCPQGHGLHVHAENVLFEVLDEENRPCAPGKTGNVYITSLHNLRGPFIRYQLGDEVTLGQERCPCGRGLPLLARVQGTNLPSFQLANGRRKPSTPVAGLLRRVKGHWQHQVIQKSLNQVTVRLAIDSTWTEQHADRLRTSLQEFFEAPIQVDIEIHDGLTVPKSGKFQSMINELS
jgi:phenylacetate-CoA ligase